MYLYSTKNNQQVRQQACKTQIPPHGLKQRCRLQYRMPHTILFVLIQSVAAYIPESNAAPATPREPKFTKMGEDLFG